MMHPNKERPAIVTDRTGAKTCSTPIVVAPAIHVAPAGEVASVDRLVAGNTHDDKPRVAKETGSPSAAGCVAKSLLEAACGYIARGFSVLPMRGKRPSVPIWKTYQQRLATREEIEDWFQDTSVTGVAIVLGGVSGGVAVRDFDTVEGYEKWTKQYPELARTLPTVRTARGYHVYALGQVPKTITLSDGELRGGGSLCVLPPSHHESGLTYEWVVPLPDAELPRVDPLNVGFLDADESTETTEEDRSHGSVFSVLSVDDKTIDEILKRSLPTGEGQRNQAIFRLARALKAIPELALGPISTLRQYVLRWHTLALPVIRTKPFDETWSEFVHAWERVRFPLGQDPLRMVMEAVEREPPPAVAARYDSPRTRRLIGVCRELQRLRPGIDFYLSTRMAGQLIEIDHVEAWKALNMLVADGVLVVVRKGNENKATRYRYLGGD